MNMKRLVYILIGVVLISFGIGALSLRHNDNFRFNDAVWNNSGNFDFSSEDSKVKIDSNGIRVKDGDDYVNIGWNGIKVTDGKDEVSIGWDGIDIEEGDGSKVNIGKWNLFNSNKALKSVVIDEEKFVKIDSQKNINISSSFVDIRLNSSDREDIKVKYHGRIVSNVVPQLKISELTDTIEIKLEDDKKYNYIVRDSDLVLEVLIPKDYKKNITINGSSSNITVADTKLEYLSIFCSSGDIEAENILGVELSMTTSSGYIEVSNLEGDKVDLTSSSGYIEVNESKGLMVLNTSSGDIELDNDLNQEDINIVTSSGDISIAFGDNPSYQIKGKSSSGNFKSYLPMTVEENKDNKFKATLGLGENNIHITTSSGDVKFIKN